MAMKSLAQRAGVDILAVSHVEAGRNLLSADLARKSAEALGVDALTLMIANNEITLKERIVSGVDSPRRAVGFVHTLLELLESAELGSTPSILRNYQ
jgi:transcriptional regulator with XRE-family HTH domain